MQYFLKIIVLKMLHMIQKLFFSPILNAKVQIFRMLKNKILANQAKNYFWVDMICLVAK